MARLEERTDGAGQLVLSLTGEVDLAVVDELILSARRSLAESDHLQVELSGVTFIDSSGLGALVLIRNEAGAAGKTFALTQVPAPMARLLDLTGLTQAFDIRDPRS